ncbi:MAG: hypothetical protein LVQ97_03100 [Candidatus Micrarchaeales archaeon]|jgi:hypothetical protein|uniref:Uncharacterized protein n=1 Tax=Candidatus Micrarchaeum acidiphilum ARMAN-2 TaxID=425595 RepID=C7DGB4_MICA2|nr:MAG: hypothetical protein UNLARM2_0118 [Candidatus Micrarchaeum acidiphilum ARMAN-2]MCW6161146.1 hypothetical protein [Candidatus Micrarchaeales archaeon]
MKNDMNEDEEDCGCGCGEGRGGMHGRMHSRMGMHMAGMGPGFGTEDSVDEMGPLHKEKLVEKLKLYKEDLEAQAKFIGKRIDEIQKGSSESK